MLFSGILKYAREPLSYVNIKKMNETFTISKANASSYLFISDLLSAQMNAPNTFLKRAMKLSNHNATSLSYYLNREM